MTELLQTIKLADGLDHEGTSSGPRERITFGGSTLDGEAQPWDTDGAEGAADRGCLSDEEVTALLELGPAAMHGERASLHLSSCAECRDLVLVACLALDDCGGKVGAKVSFCLAFEPGSIVGRRYCVRRLLGRGGMGEVYEAFDLLLRQRVALKAVRANACDDPRAVSRLIREVRLGRRVQHPNVCRTYDLGIDTQNDELHAPTYFCTMQLLMGVTLRRELQTSGALSIRGSLQIGADVLSGLSAIHRAGIIHRDIKGDNIVIADPRSGSLRATLLDFGLAMRQVDAARRGSANEPELPCQSGSVAYMAPEQALGQPFGPSADIFSFGVALFEAMTGRLPFEGIDPARITFASRRRELPLCRVGAILPNAPAALEAFLTRCLRTEPSERFRDASDALQHLAQLST